MIRQVGFRGHKLLYHPHSGTRTESHRYYREFDIPNLEQQFQQ